MLNRNNEECLRALRRTIMTNRYETLVRDGLSTNVVVTHLNSLDGKKNSRGTTDDDSLICLVICLKYQTVPSCSCLLNSVAL